MQFDWHFWIDFNERCSPNGGGVAVTVTADTLDEAVNSANSRAHQTMELLDMDDGNVGIYFTTDTPFGLLNLAEIHSHMDNNGPSRLFGEDDSDWLKRVNIFIDEETREGCHCDTGCIRCAAGIHTACPVECEGEED